MEPIVVLRSNDCCFLGILHSAAAANIPVIPVIFTWEGAPTWYSDRSRHLENAVTIPNPYEQPQAALGTLLALGKRLLLQWGKPLLIIPSSDTNLMFLQNNFATLSPYFCQIGAVDFQASRLDVIQKDSCATLLEDAAINAPQTFPVLSSTDIEDVADQVTYPCIYKPLEKGYGQRFYQEHQQCKAIECKNPKTLKQKLQKEMKSGFALIVQEKIPHQSNNDEIPFYLYADKQHNIRMAATARKLSVYPKYGTALHLKLAWDEELLPIAKQIVKALKWRGIMMIEFMRDARDQQWKVIEINARPWLFVGFFSHCDLNYIKMLYADWSEELKEATNLQVPDQNILEKQPEHIDLPELFKQQPEKEQQLSLLHWLNTTKNEISLSYHNQDDPEPGEASLQNLLEKRGSP